MGRKGEIRPRRERRPGARAVRGRRRARRGAGAGKGGGGSMKTAKRLSALRPRPSRPTPRPTPRPKKFLHLLYLKKITRTSGIENSPRLRKENVEDRLKINNNNNNLTRRNNNNNNNNYNNHNSDLSVRRRTRDASDAIRAARKPEV